MEMNYIKRIIDQVLFSFINKMNLSTCLELMNFIFENWRRESDGNKNKMLNISFIFSLCDLDLFETKIPSN